MEPALSYSPFENYLRWNVVRDDKIDVSQLSMQRCCFLRWRTIRDEGRKERDPTSTCIHNLTIATNRLPSMSTGRGQERCCSVTVMPKTETDETAPSIEDLPFQKEDGAVWRTTPLPQQLAARTPQRLNMELTACAATPSLSRRNDVVKSYGCRDSALEVTPQRHNRLEVWDRLSRTLVHKASQCTQPVGGTGKRWLAEEIHSLAPQYRRPEKPAIANQTRQDVHNHVSRQLVDFDARNQSPRTTTGTPAEMLVLGSAASQKGKKTRTGPTNQRQEHRRQKRQRPARRVTATSRQKVLESGPTSLLQGS